MATKKALARLESATCVGRRMKFKDKVSRVRSAWGTITEEVYIMVADYKHMIQRVNTTNLNPMAASSATEPVTTRWTPTESMLNSVNLPSS
jgi:hypothetical protein